MASLFDVFNNNNAKDAANAQTAGLIGGYNYAAPLQQQGISAIQQGYAGAIPAVQTNYAAALQPYQMNYNTGTAGVKSLTDLLGITADPATIQQQLAATPGYQFQLQQGNENVLRNAARTGALASGGTNVDLLKYGQGLAGTTYEQAVQDRTPFLNYQSNAATGLSNVNQGLGQTLAGLYTGQGKDLYSAYGNLGQLGYNTQTGIGNANANADLANQQASANMWSALLGGGNLAAKLAGGPVGTAAGNAAGGLFGSFSNPGSSTGTAAGYYGGSPGSNPNLNPATYGNISGGFAEGGRPPPGRPAIVGERGPEVFIPDRPGTVVPNNRSDLFSRYRMAA